MTTLREAAERALEAMDDLHRTGDTQVFDLCHRETTEALRAALAQPLTIEKLRDALVASRVIDPGAVEDPDAYDDGVMLHRIEALFRRIV